MKILPRFMPAKVQEFPVVGARAVQSFVLNFKAPRLGQVGRRKGRGTQPRYASCIRRNLGFKENDMHVLRFQDESNRAVIYKRDTHLGLKSAGSYIEP